MTGKVTYRELKTIDADTKYRLRTVVTIPREGAAKPLIATGSSDGAIQVGIAEETER